jgi:xylulokinase
MPGRSSSALSSLGLPFDPYDSTPLPARVIATGAAANFPSVANLVGDVFNAPVFVPSTQVDSAQLSPHRNAPAPGFPGRASLGAAYVARWVWGRERAGGRGLGGFEEEMRRLLSKRWIATGGTPLRTSVNAVGGLVMPGSGANSGTSTPYGHPGPRSALGSTVFVEEDEDEVEEMERSGGGYLSMTEREIGGRLRTQTSSTAETSTSITSGAGAPSTALTTPELGNGSPNDTPAPTPLTPIVAIPTSDTEAQLGLAKVAEPDFDAFVTYAAIVPEYCRLEGMLVKALV